MGIEWRPRARKDLVDIVDYIDIERPNAALAVLERVQRRVALLAGQPKLGRPGRVAGTRELVVNRTPYLVAYRVNEDAVVILSVVHGARRWPAGF